MPASFSQFFGSWWSACIEIGLLAVGIYHVYLYFRGTRSARVLTGFLIFSGSVVGLSQVFNLVVIRWMVARHSASLMLVAVVIFQPELRRLLAEVGSRSFFSGKKQDKRTVDQLCECVFELASRRCGALVAIERDIGLRSYAETGVSLDALFSTELALTIFHPKTALHDGGLILRDERIVAAACIFPVSQRESLDRSYGLRHRAGLGLSEETDALAVVVSEETGSVSLCYGQKIERGLSRVELRTRLGRILLREGGVGVPAEKPEASPRPNQDEEDFNASGI